MKKNKWHYKIINNSDSGIFWGIKSRLGGINIHYNIIEVSFKYFSFL